MSNGKQDKNDNSKKDTGGVANSILSRKGKSCLPLSTLPVFKGFCVDEFGTYIYLFRKIRNTSFYKDSCALHLAIHCLLKATRFPKQVIVGNQTIDLKTGQLVTGRHKLHLETGIKEATIRNKLLLLSNVNFLDSKATTKYSIITVIKYENYQIKIIKRTADKPTDGQQMNTNKKDKNDKNKDKLSIEDKVKDTKYVNDNQNRDNIYTQVIMFLNSKSHRVFRATSEQTRRLIRARLKEGYTLQDFKSVITKKTEEWLGDEKMDVYIRPSTLFGTKFENYLTQQKPFKSSEEADAKRWAEIKKKAGLK